MNDSRVLEAVGVEAFVLTSELEAASVDEYVDEIAVPPTG